MKEFADVLGNIFLFLVVVALNIFLLALPVMAGIWLARHFGIL